MQQHIYLYDGSFEGLLTAVARAIKSKKPVKGIWATENYVPELFVHPINVKSDCEQARRLVDYLNQISSKAVHLVVQAWLSENINTGNLLHDFIHLSLAKGPSALSLYSNDSVRTLYALSKKVSFEAHRLNGMLRFRILEDGLQYAPFESDHNVIGLCARHFRQRFGNRRWMLHDLGRRFALYCDASKLQPVVVDEDFSHYVEREGEIPGSQLSEEEHYYQNLWRRFHSSIANPDRENKLLQRSFMPRRYWHFMVEVNTELHPRPGVKIVR